MDLKRQNIVNYRILFNIEKKEELIVDYVIYVYPSYRGSKPSLLHFKNG